MIFTQNVQIQQSLCRNEQLITYGGYIFASLCMLQASWGGISDVKKTIDLSIDLTD